MRGHSVGWATPAMVRRPLTACSICADPRLPAYSAFKARPILSSYQNAEVPMIRALLIAAILFPYGAGLAQQTLTAPPASAAQDTVFVKPATFAVYMGFTTDGGTDFTLGGEFTVRKVEWKAFGVGAFFDYIFSNRGDFFLGATAALLPSQKPSGVRGRARLGFRRLGFPVSCRGGLRDRERRPGYRAEDRTSTLSTARRCGDSGCDRQITPDQVW